MKILKITDKRAFFIKPSDWMTGVCEEAQPYKAMTTINKDDLVSIIDYLLENDVEMDEYGEGLVLNPAEEIIYKQVYEGLKKVENEKQSILESVDKVFEESVKKYD